MSGNESTAAWIVKKLKEERDLANTVDLGAGYLQVVRDGKASFTAVAIGIDDVIALSHVQPLFVGAQKPEFVVNVPSKAIWSGEAIEFIHKAPAAFGKLGELTRAAKVSPPSSYRNKEYAFFEQIFRQHSAVKSVDRLFDRKYLLHRYRDLPELLVVLVDAYDLSAEDVRRARDLYGHFDVALKMTSYGAVTSAAQEAADAMGAQALKLGDFMGRLNKK